MLAGKYNYYGHIYNVEAYDFETNISIFLSAPLTRDKLFLDQGILLGEEVNHPTWEHLYVSVGTGNVSADCYTVEDNGVTYKSRVNMEVIVKLGEILRGMKLHCNKRHREDLDEIYDTGFNPSRITTYTFGDKGYMKLEMTTLVEVEYKGDGVYLKLEEDGTYEEKIFKQTTKQYRSKLILSEFVDESSSNIGSDDDWDFSDDDDDYVFSLSEIIEKNPDKNYLWLKDRKYEVVKGIERVEEICKIIWNHDGLVSFDTETTGLTVNITSRYGQGDRLVGMVFSIKPGEAWYFPIAHKKIPNICTPENENYIIEKYFKPLLECKDLILYNGEYDWRVMHNYGICLNMVHDLYILFHVTLWNDHRGMGLSLKDVTSRFLHRDSFKLSDFVRGRFGDNVRFWDLEEESVKYYACPDTDNLIELFQWAIDNQILEKYDAKKTYEIEVAFSLVIAYQEYYGHCVDISKIDALEKGIKRDKEESYRKMVEIVGHDFNPKSSKDLKVVFFEEQNYPVVAKTDKGNPSTGKEARKTWSKEKNLDGSPKYPLANLLQIYSDNATLESNFIKNIDKFATDSGLMFSSVQQFLETGRVSVNNPNYQSYSDTVKKYIIPRKGYYALDADYSSVEARIMVSMAGCKDMVEKLKDPDMDYHTAKASDMFGVPYELVSPQLRKMSKGVNFGILYGLGDWNLAINLGRTGSPENARWAAKQKELYFTGMPELKGFIETSKHQGIQNHFSTTFFNRRRYYDPRKERKDRIERQSCNARIQGTAADIYKIAMVRLFNQIRKRGWVGSVLISAFVHDECFLEVSNSLDPCVVLGVLRKCMMLNIKGWCPLFIGSGFGRNWYEAKKTEIPVQVQEIMVNTWGDTGLDWWNGDSSRLYEWEVNMINDYRRDRVINYLKDENNWGKVFSPVENSLAHEVMEEIKKGVKVHGIVTTDFEIKSDMLENLYEFCKAFGIEDLYNKANIQRPVHNESKNLESSEEDIEYEETPKEEIAKARVNIMGAYMEVSHGIGKIYFKYSDEACDRPLMNQIYNIIKKNPGKSDVYAVKDDGIYTTGMQMNQRALPQILQVCLSWKNMRDIRGTA